MPRTNTPRKTPSSCEGGQGLRCSKSRGHAHNHECLQVGIDLKHGNQAVRGSERDDVLSADDEYHCGTWVRRDDLGSESSRGNKNTNE